MDDEPAMTPNDDLAKKLVAGLDVLLAEAFGPRSDPPFLDPASGAESATEGLAGRFDLIEEIGRGGMGVVFRAHDVRLGREVALKVLRDHLRQHPEATGRFLEEARIGARLQHPGIVPVYDLGVLADGSPFLSMNLVRGNTFASLLGDHRTQDVDRSHLLSIVLQVCQTVAFAHSRGVVHRDLKPSNVVLGDFGEVQVLDWGLASVVSSVIGAEDGKDAVPVDPEATRVRGRGVTGTYEYMPPEESHSECRQTDPRADVFSLGAMLCEVLTGFPPYTGVSRAEVRARATSGDLTETFERLKGCRADREIIHLTRACLDPDPLRRPHDAGAVAVALARHLAAGEERATAARLAEAAATARATEARQRELAARRARFWILGLSVLVVVSVTVGFGMLWMQQREAGERRSVAERAASDALARAHELVGRAQQDTTGTIGTWERALAAARESVAVAEAGQVSEETRQSARAFLDATASSVARARVELEQRQNDLETVERLDQIAAGYGDHQSPRRLDNEYSAAFRDHGLDMNQDGDHILQRVRASAIFEDLVAAIENWGTMLVGVPQPVPAYHEKGRRLLDLAAILDQDPLRAQILAADAKGDRERLRAVAEKLDIASVTPRTVKLLAFRLAALGEFQASRDVLRRALRAYPGDFWLNLAMGISLQGDKGLPWLTAARALRPQSAGVIARIARAEESAGRLDEARSLLERAVDLQPRDGRLLDSLSQLCQRMGDREAALSAARRWVEERPREARAHFRLSLCLHWAGLSSLAEASLDQAIALDGTQADWLYLRAARRYGVWDDAAEEAFREVLRVDPAHGGAHHGLGSVLLGQERLHEAVTHLREAERRLGQKAPAPRPTLLVAENLLAVYERFKAICAGDEDPASSDEAIHFAHLAVQVRRFGSATRLFAWAFEEDPTLGSHLGAGHRREAAIVATLAATDPRSREAPASPEDRRSLLSLAGAWLREDARGLTDLHETGRTRPSRLVQRLESWLAAEEVLGPLWDDPDLTEWRPAECRENEAAWSRMRALLATLE